MARVINKCIILHERRGAIESRAVAMKTLLSDLKILLVKIFSFLLHTPIKDFKSQPAPTTKTWTAHTFGGNRLHSLAATMQNDTLGWLLNPRANPFDRKGRDPCTMEVDRTSSAPIHRSLRF